MVCMSGVKMRVCKSGGREMQSGVGGEDEGEEEEGSKEKDTKGEEKKEEKGRDRS